MHRSLAYFWQINLAMLLGVAIATAVLTGALIVGDSVRESLRHLVLHRLGGIDYALTSNRFFRQELAVDLSNEPTFKQRFHGIAPAIFLRGTAIAKDTKSRASKVNIYGIDHQFIKLWQHGEPTDPPQNDVSPGDLTVFLTKNPGQIFPSIIINESLQKEVNAEVGDSLLVAFEQQNDIHRESLLGRRDYSDVVQQFRLTVTKIVPDNGIGRFGLHPQQHLPMNAFIAMPALQKALGIPHKVNALLVGNRKFEQNASADLQRVLSQAWKLSDLGLIVDQQKNYFAIESSQFILSPNITTVIEELATEQNLLSLPVMTYLANQMTTNDQIISYSTISALNIDQLRHKDKNGLDRTPFGELKLIEGEYPTSLADDEILLNQWAAADLNLLEASSATVDVSYYIVEPQEKLVTRNTKFRLKGIVSMGGLATDQQLTPDLPGIHDADDISEWNAPFPINFRQVRSRDETYWDKFGAAPKAFVSERAGRQLWGNRFGELTAIRIANSDRTKINETSTTFQNQLLTRINPEQVGLVFQSVKAKGLEASSGATDFSMLFIGFSLFLIVSAVLLIGLLFRLNIEQRTKEIGILLSMGYTIRSIRWRLLKEGLILAGIGGLLGLVGAVAYARLMLVGLQTWWLEAVGTSFLILHTSLPNLAIGYIISLIVVLFSIAWTVQKLSGIPAKSLVTGTTDKSLKSKNQTVRPKKIFAFIFLVAALVLIMFSILAATSLSTGLFFSSGILLLLSALTFFSIWLSGRKSTSLNHNTTIKMGARNSARHPERSMICTTLIGCACFIIVAVGANRHSDTPRISHLQKASGNGGFAWVAESAIPLHQDLNSETDRFELGFSDSESKSFHGHHIYSCRLLPGEDTSCLNLYQPQKPHILGVTNDFIRRGGFQFHQQIEKRKNPWELLNQNIEEGVVPVIGDYNSVLWILHLGLGKDLIIQNESGQELRLRFVGLLQSSIFQSELLMSETNFTKHFSSQSGYGYFLIQTPNSNRNVEKVAHILEEKLGDYGFDATNTTEKLANYRAVENTYLSTFQTLGGLGLLLGTFGLGILLLRNTIERRGELAMLRAVGFRQSTLSTMILAENAFLLVVGILIGTSSALTAIAPHLIKSGTEVPWISLVVTLILVFSVGITASAVGIWVGFKIPLLMALKEK